MERWLAATLVLAACGPAVDRVAVSPARLSLDAAGATAQLRASVLDRQGAVLPLAVRWTSRAPGVAEVDAAGRVTARRTGETLVAAEAGGAAGAALVQVSIPVAAALEPAGLELVGLPSSAGLRLVLADEAGRPVPPRGTAWSSSDERVARVADGTVSAVGPGRAVVTARALGLAATAEVEVRLPEFARVAVRPGRLALAVGQAVRLEASALDGAGRPVEGVPLAFASSDERVARVGPDGAVSAVGPGRAKVTVSAGGRSAAAAVSVSR